MFNVTFASGDVIEFDASTTIHDLVPYTEQHGKIVTIEKVPTIRQPRAFPVERAVEDRWY